MRQITTDAFTVYQLDELEPDAREKAIANVAALMGGDWWDQSDVEQVNENIIYTLGRALGTPGIERFGEGDFPGVPEVTLEGWDADRGSCVLLKGVLTRENAPALPWATGIVEVVLRDQRDYTTIDVETDEDELDPEQERDLTVVRNELIELASAMEEAVEAVLAKGVTAARETVEYICSAENAVSYIEGNEREFQADGTLYA